MALSHQLGCVLGACSIAAACGTVEHDAGGAVAGSGGSASAGGTPSVGGTGGLSGSDAAASDACTSECSVLEPNGEVCMLAAECSSGVCSTDGVCCNVQCAGPCEACVSSKTGIADGTCAPVSAGTDPDDECTKSCSGTPHELGVCAGDGTCELGELPECAPAACGWTVQSTNISLFGDAVARDIAVDANGNAFMVGHFQGGFDVGCGPLTSAQGLNVFVAKLSPNGTCLWSKQFGDDQDTQAGMSVAPDAFGNPVIGGQTAGTLDFGCGPLSGLGGFVAKLDSNGGCLWSKSTGSAGYIQSVAVDTADSVVVAGTNAGSLDLGCGPSSGVNTTAFVAKLDTTGSCEWTLLTGGPAIQHATAVAVDAGGNIVVIGDGSSNVDWGCGPIPNDGQWMAKLSPGGACAFTKTFPGSGIRVLLDVAIQPVGDVVLTGEMQGAIDLGCGTLSNTTSFDMFVARLDGLSGACEWSKQANAPDEFQSFGGVAWDPLGNVLFTGSFANTFDFGCGPLTSAGSSDVMITKFEPSGLCLWSKRAGDSGFQSGSAIAADPFGNVFVTGHTAGALDFGCGNTTQSGPRDAFVTKLLP